MSVKEFRIDDELLTDVILDHILQVLNRGGLIVYPTETAYGLGCDAFNEIAVKKIYRIKQRSKKHPLPVIVNSLEMADKIAFLSPEIEILSKKFHPGPLVIATQKKAQIPDIVNPSGIAFRISSNKLVQKIISGFNKPLVSTSANLSGNPTPYSISDIKSQLDYELIDIILDAGVLPKRKPSTIVDFQLKPSPQIIREGDISSKELLKTLGIEKSKWTDYLQGK
jgi:L-threonylcarbamoyladenylate synthase